MKRQRYFLVCSIAIFVSMILVFAGVAMAGGQKYKYKDKHKDKAPEFKVDPSWPKPLPNHWLIGQVPGVAVSIEKNK